MSRNIVCDFGSGTSKVGFAGNYSPISVFSSVVGRPHPQVNRLLFFAILTLLSLSEVL